MKTATPGAQTNKTRNGWRRPSVLLPSNTFVFGSYVGLMIALVPLYTFARGYEVGAIGVIVASQGVFQLGLPPL